MNGEPTNRTEENQSAQIERLKRENGALRNHIFNGQDIIRTMFNQPENETVRAWAKEWANTEISNG